jgi:hypothetical protein
VKHLVKDYHVLQDLDELLIAIWKLFKYSPQRYAVFQQVQETYKLTQWSFIKAVSTRSETFKVKTIYLKADIYYEFKQFS